MRPPWASTIPVTIGVQALPRRAWSSALARKMDVAARGLDSRSPKVSSNLTEVGFGSKARRAAGAHSSSRSRSRRRRKNGASNRRHPARDGQPAQPACGEATVRQLTTAWTIHHCDEASTHRPGPARRSVSNIWVRNCWRFAYPWNDCVL